MPTSEPPSAPPTAKLLTAESFAKVIPRAAELQRLLLEEQTDEALSLAYGTVALIIGLNLIHPQTLGECDTETVFGGALPLLSTLTLSGVHNVTDHGVVAVARACRALLRLVIVKTARRPAPRLAASIAPMRPKPGHLGENAT